MLHASEYHHRVRAATCYNRRVANFSSAPHCATATAWIIVIAYADTSTKSAKVKLTFLYNAWHSWQTNNTFVIPRRFATKQRQSLRISPIGLTSFFFFFLLPPTTEHLLSIPFYFFSFFSFLFCFSFLFFFFFFLFLFFFLLFLFVATPPKTLVLLMTTNDDIVIIYHHY